MKQTKTPILHRGFPFSSLRKNRSKTEHPQTQKNSNDNTYTELKSLESFFFFLPTNNFQIYWKARGIFRGDKSLRCADRERIHPDAGSGTLACCVPRGWKGPGGRSEQQKASIVNTIVLQDRPGALSHRDGQ